MVGTDGDDTSRRDRAAGSVLGLAWGDAFGAPIEGWSPERIREHYGVYDMLPRRYPTTVLALDERGRLGLRPLGLHTDDTQQALALLAVTLAGWSPERWAEWLVAGEEARAWRGTGPNFRAAVRALRAGGAHTRSGSPSAGIGAAMRSGPLGALLHDDAGRLRTVAYESATVTHADLRASTTAYAVAHVVAELVAGTAPDRIVELLPDRLATAERSWIAAASADWTVTATDEPRMSSTFAAVIALAPSDPAALAKAVSDLGRSHVAAHVRAHPNHGFAPLGGVHAILSGLLFDREPQQVLTDLVSVGGDTDTVGAICGSVLGARHGSAWVPVDRLLDRERIGRYAVAVADRGAPPEDRATLMAEEARLTELEARFVAAREIGAPLDG